MAEDKPRILVVEDDAGIRSMLARRLTQYELVFAACQSECYEQLDSVDFDLVLLDMKLPRKPGEMTATNDVGIDILDWIRKQGFAKRGSSVKVPVIVMTAHGYDPIATMRRHGAVDYIHKPFVQDESLEERITDALEGRNALTAASNIANATVELALHPTDTVVRVDRFSYDNEHHYKLLRLLCELYVADRNNGSRLDAYRGLTGDELADMLKTSNKAVRQHIANFRSEVKRDFQKSLGRTLDTNDIIENPRTRGGYRLNPRVVHVVRWEP